MKLFHIRARDGHDTFDAEYQNDPINQKDATFSTLIFWVEPSPRWIHFGSCDPSLGKHGRGRDPSAILVGGFDRKEGILDVRIADIGRKLPDLIIERIIELQREFMCFAWGIESVQFQEFFRTTLVKRSAQRKVAVPAVAMTPNTDKDLRIASLQPHTANGLIRFQSDQSTLLSQLRNWPKADHDDGPDALHILWTLAYTRSVGLDGFVTRGRNRLRDDQFRGY